MFFIAESTAKFISGLKGSKNNNQKTKKKKKEQAGETRRKKLKNTLNDQ